jgi:hypothetical protein
MTMVAMGMVAAGGFLGVGYLKKKCPHGVPGLVLHKTPVFGVRLPKLDQLTVVCVLGPSLGGSSVPVYRLRFISSCPLPTEEAIKGCFITETFASTTKQAVK